MSLYTRARKHIDMKRVKEMREEKIKREKIAEILRQQEEIRAELEYIDAEESKHSDWRAEVSEQMTSSGTFFTTLPARGDVDLEAVTQTATPGSDNSGGSDGTYSFGDYDGTGNGGFVFRLDTRKYDTLKFSASGGNATRIELSVGDEDFQTLSSGTNTITISSANRGQNVLFTFNAFKSGGSGATGASISGTAFQRRLPVNAFVGLDDPDASSFVRGGLGADKERRSKLKDMLDAGNEYLSKYTNITPSQTSPGDIELANVTSDARNPMGTGDQAFDREMTVLLASPMVQAAASQGLAALASLVGGVGTAKQIMNQINRTSDPYGADLPGATATGSNPRARNLTPQQQAEVEAAGNELRDARRALTDLPADATDAQKDMAQERLDRATKNRQRVRNKHKQENKNRKD